MRLPEQGGVYMCYLVGDDGDDGGVVGGDVGPPRHGSRPRILLPGSAADPMELSTIGDRIVLRWGGGRGGHEQTLEEGTSCELQAALPGGPGPTWPALALIAAASAI